MRTSRTTAHTRMIIARIFIVISLLKDKTMIAVNKQGVTRIVYLTKKYAIKLPRIRRGWMMFIQGMYSNLSENQCWSVCQGEYLCPVLFSFGGLILVMPRIEICKTEEDIISIPNEEGEDRKPINYGFYENRVVCVDYPYHRIKPYKR